MKSFTKVVTLFIALLVTLWVGLVPKDKVWANASGEQANQVIVGQSFDVAADQAYDTLVVIGSTGTLNGRVNELVVIGSDIEIGETAVVNRSMVNIGSHARVHPQATVRGEDVRVSLPESWAQSLSKGWGSWMAPGWMHDGGRQGGAQRVSWQMNVLWALGSWVAAVLLGALYMMIFPVFHRNSVDFLAANSGTSFGFGILGYLGVAPGVMILVITIIGILLVPAFLVAVAAFVGIGYISAAGFIGQRLKVRWSEASLRTEVYAMALGVLILKVVSLIPFFGGLVVAIVTTAGFGAVLRTLYVLIRSRRAVRPRDADGIDRGYAPA
jgi:hypothetical protein